MTDRGYTEKWYPAPSQHFAITREEFLAARP
jgi:hypothetical protein